MAIITNNKLDLTGRIERLFNDRNVKIVLSELNIPETTYYRSIKTGTWKLEHVINIAKYFDVSIDWLVHGVNREAELERELSLNRKYIETLLNDKNRTTATVPNGATGDQ